ncbi:MAG: hypothetical protein R3B59_09785 [Dehalococcoidia bacterium]
MGVMGWGGRIGRRLAGRLALLGVALVLLGGCVRAEIGVHVEDDGSGTATVLFAFKESFIDLMSSLDEGSSEEFDPEEVFSDIDRSQLPEGTEVDRYEEDGFVGSRITMPFRDVQELAGLLGFVTTGAAVPSEAAEDEGGFERFAIERTDDGWRLDAVAAALTTEEDLESADDAFTQEFFEDASFTITIQLPGRIQEHNADEVDGNELTWNLDFESTEPRELRAVSSTSGDGDGPPWVLIGAVAAGVVALAAVGWDINRRRRVRVPA